MKDGKMVLIAQPLLESRIGLYYIWSLSGPQGVYKVLHHLILIIHFDHTKCCIHSQNN
jgi:hypothetical protein